jgi:predicted nucleic acid-binding protein
MRIYLDACCVNRPYDDQKQDRIRLQAEAILLIMQHCRKHEWEWIGSEVLNFEIQQMSNLEKKNRIELLLSSIFHVVPLKDVERKRGKELEALGFQAFDALHIACAESGKADILLTTDVKFLKKSSKCAHKLKTSVKDPVSWLMEVMEVKK